jgi:predicted Zn-dependent protease
MTHLVKVIKSISSLLLIFFLITFIAKRDFGALFEKHTSSTSVIKKNTTIAQEESDTNQKENPPQPTVLPSSPTKEQSQETQVVQKAVETISKKVETYIPLTHVESDTVEGYTPSVSPCATAMGFKIGTFDARFGITKTDFLNEVTEASKIWNLAYKKPLFIYNENGPLTINLIYDSRQEKTTEINYLTLEIDNSKKNAEELKQFYDTEKELYQKQADALTLAIAQFKEKQQAYVDKVNLYNAQGGAQKIEYDAMMRELDDLKTEENFLTAQQKNLVDMTVSINKKVTKYNELVVYINTLIKQVNTLGGSKFTEGRFSPSTNTIDIYQYNNLTKLRRVITHELGHAIGLDHTEEPSSIMYAVNSGTTTTLSKSDLNLLSLTCNEAQ